MLVEMLAKASPKAFTEPLWYEKLEGMANQLPAGVAKEPLCLPVEMQDDSFDVDDYYRVGGQIEDRLGGDLPHRHASVRSGLGGCRLLLIPHHHRPLKCL
jgi:hypothetical protein